MRFWIESTTFLDRLQEAWIPSLLWGLLLAGPAVLASSLMWDTRLKQRWLQGIAMLWLGGTITAICLVGPFQVTAGPPTVNWVGLAWIAGTAASLILLFARLIRAERFCAGGNDPDAQLRESFETEADAMRATRVKVLVHPDLQDTLAVCQKQTVFVSPRLREALSETQVRAVLRHEIAHAYHRHWRQWLWETILLAPMFWHPLGLWIHSALREAREMEADDAARQVDCLAYAEALLRLQKVARRQPIFAVGRPCNPRWRRLQEPFVVPGFPRQLAAKTLTAASTIVAGLIGHLLLPDSGMRIQPLRQGAATELQRFQVRATKPRSGEAAKTRVEAVVIVGEGAPF